jgi:hypothetical protein
VLGERSSLDQPVLRIERAHDSTCFDSPRSDESSTWRSRAATTIKRRFAASSLDLVRSAVFVLNIRVVACVVAKRLRDVHVKVPGIACLVGSCSLLVMACSGLANFQMAGGPMGNSGSYQSHVVPIGGYGSGGKSGVASGGSMPAGTVPVGGSSASSPTTDGTTACATRSETYSTGVQFTYQYASVVGYPDCIPTCGERADSLAALPAGPCTNEPTCAMLAFWICPTFCVASGTDAATPERESGSLGGNGFLCACANTTNGRRWSCTIAQ